MSITLPPEMEEFVRDEVASGRFDSPAHLVSEAIGILRARERQRQVLRNDIQAAVDQIENGDYVEYDRASLPEFLDELKQEARRAHQQPTS